MDKRENQDNLTDAGAPLVAPSGPMSSALAATLAGAQNMTFPELERLADLTIAREQSAMRTDVLFGLSSGSLESQKPGSNLDRHNRMERERLLRQKTKDKSNDLTLLAMLDDLAEFEAGLAADYGENFAENLFSDLNAKGLISDEDHKEIMSIQDEAERKKAIAAKIQEGLDDGSIKPEDLDGHPWAEEWLEKHHKIEEAYQREAQAGLNGEIAAKDMQRDSNDIATQTTLADAPDVKSAFEHAVENLEQSEATNEAAPDIAVTFNPDEFSI